MKRGQTLSSPTPSFIVMCIPRKEISSQILFVCRDTCILNLFLTNFQKLRCLDNYSSL